MLITMYLNIFKQSIINSKNDALTETALNYVKEVFVCPT